MPRRLLICLWVLCLGSWLAGPGVPPAQAAQVAGTYSHQLYLSTIIRGVSGRALAGPALAEFSAAVADGAAGVVRGVYVANRLALPVVQQPAGRPEYVAGEPGVATQFSLAATYGVTGLLAHNTAAGQLFLELTAGERVVVVYGDGRQRAYVISRILRYQALQPYSVTSDFVDLETGDRATAVEVFQRVYMRPHQVVLQTCLAAEGVSSWGRLFVIATPDN